MASCGGWVMNKQIENREYPDNWEVIPLKYFAKEGATNFVDGPFGSDLKVSDYTKEGVRVLQLQNLGDGAFKNKSKIYTSEAKAQQLSRCITKAGDIIIAKMAEPLARATIVPVIDKKSLIVADLIKLRSAQNVDSEYLVNFINFEDFRREAERLSTGTTRTRISLSTLKTISLPAPPLEQQQKIAKILSTVDNLIDKTQTLIDKYTAIKQGMMADLFTRGIDMTTGDTPNSKGGKLRPRVEDAPELYKQTELGWVPKEWEIKHLGELSEKVTSGSRDWAVYYADEGDLFVRISNLTREHINFRWKSIRYVDIGNGSEGERTRLVEGDILITITADLGIIGVVPSDFGRAFINQHTALVRLEKEVVNPRFIGNFLHSYAGQIQFEKFNDSGAKAGLNLPTVASLACILPSLDEQALISERIDSIDIQIEMYKVELSKYQSQKKGLMQDLLTGKVKVNCDE
jgi:type I restriction enzyme S subunit